MILKQQWFELNNNLNNCDTKLIFNINNLYLNLYYFKLIINIDNFELTINCKIKKSLSVYLSSFPVKTSKHLIIIIM